MKRLACLALLCLAPAAPALAHPHVFVAVESEVLFSPEGKITGVRHHWKFDDMYSAFVTANLGQDGKDPTPEQMLPIAKTNAESLKEFDFFTYGKLNGKASISTAAASLNLSEISKSVSDVESDLIVQ